MAVVALSLILLGSSAPPVAAAQDPSCRYVLGFAEFVARVGEATVGRCLENQRTITGPETFNVSSKASVELYAGHAVQQTTNGVLAWSPNSNSISFYDEAGIHGIGPRGYVLTTWDDLGAPSRPSPAPPAPVLSDADEAGRQCSLIWTDALVTSVGVGLSQAEMNRRSARADAIRFLCDRAAADHGTRGVACFQSAWQASLGMEQVFPGSGRQTYEDSYARCIAGR